MKNKILYKYVNEGYPQQFKKGAAMDQKTL